MALLAIDTSTSTLSLALGDRAGHVLAAWTTRVARMHATLLNPLIDEMLAALNMDLSDLEGVIAGVGPGSYTGVRIGVTAAKTLAFALGIPALPVSSLAAAAYSLRCCTGLIVPVWDARRGAVYTAVYRSRDGHFSQLATDARRDRAAFGETLNTIADGDTVHLLGDSALQAQREWQEQSGLTRIIVYGETAAVRAEDLFALGCESFAQRLPGREEGSHGENANALVPRYLQLAEAEARWLQKERGSGDDGSGRTVISPNDSSGH
ncbi:MAG: tRNA (adenosine(37)-N6)-threonylcarbamoyltransferase complex dimerization subunit type 1 TsaB [Bacilli bacterium]